MTRTPPSQNVLNNRGSLNSVNVPRNYKGGSRGCPAWLLARLKAQSDAKLDLWKNPFDTVSQLCETLGLSNPRFADWRICPSEMGEINGLPTSRGLLVATNGLMVLIYRSDVSYFIGHRDAWVSDPIDVEIPKPEKQVSAKRLLAQQIADILQE